MNNERVFDKCKVLSDFLLLVLFLAFFSIKGKGNELRHLVTKEEILTELARQLQVHIELENLQLPTPLSSLEYELPLRLLKSIPKPQGKVQWTLSIKIR